MIFLINSVEKPANHFILPEMSLSSGRQDLNQVIFEIKVTKAELIDYCAEAYKTLCQELKADEELMGEVEDLLGQYQYPELSQVFLHADLCLEVFGYYLLDDWLGTELQQQGQSESERIYWIDQLEKCSLQSQFIVFGGICYRRKEAYESQLSQSKI